MKKRHSVFLSAISGNILEYYDFTVYSVFSLIIGKVFFPDQTETVQILSSLAVFAVGFVGRPIGGIVFGYIGDRHGRRVALICSMVGMATATFSMGLIPGYDQIGIYAPIILVAMRLVQGLCISGEGAGAAIFVLEHFHNLRPGFITGLVHGSNIAGTLFATLVGIFIENYFFGTEYAWRFAFILGGIMGLGGFYLRLRVSETPIFKALAKKKSHHKLPFFQVFKTAKLFMFITFAVGAVTSSVVYLVKTYVNVFYSSVLNLSHTTSLLYLAYTSIILMISMPISGYLSDIYGRLRMIKLSALCIILLGFPILLLMGYEERSYQIIALTGLGMIAGLISGSAYIFIISLFTPAQRYTGVAFSYNLGIAFFGGTSPMIGTWLVDFSGLYYAPAIYIMTNALIFSCIILITQKHIRAQLDKNTAIHNENAEQTIKN